MAEHSAHQELCNKLGLDHGASRSVIHAAVATRVRYGHSPDALTSSTARYLLDAYKSPDFSLCVFDDDLAALLWVCDAAGVDLAEVVAQCRFRIGVKTIYMLRGCDADKAYFGSSGPLRRGLDMAIMRSIIERSELMNECSRDSVPDVRIHQMMLCTGHDCWTPLIEKAAQELRYEAGYLGVPMLACFAGMSEAFDTWVFDYETLRDLLCVDDALTLSELLAAVGV